MALPGGVLPPFHSNSIPANRLGPRARLLGLFVFILLCALLPHGWVPAYAALLVALYIISLFARVSVLYILKRSLVVIPFLLAALPLPFTSGGGIFATLQAGTKAIPIYKAGLTQMAGIAMKSWISIQAAILLTATTSREDVLDGLRGLGFPRLVVEVTGLMWRYMGITVDEAGRMLRARTARSSILASAGSKTGGKLAWRAKVTGGMAGSLLVRSIERSERVYAAMLSRGYDGARPEFDVEKKYDTSRQVNQTEPGETANTNKYPDVEVKDIFYQYPDGRNALRGVSLQINTGEKVALLGMNGAGKSTLLWHLNGLLPGEHDDNSSGLVRIQGIVVVEPSLKRVRAMVGLVFQNPDDQLFSPTVYDDVAYSSIHQGLPAGVIAGRVDAALRGVGMEEFSSRVPYHLSTGEKKRIAIATVLASDPAVLVLDEPTAGLDPYARRGVMELLEQLPQTMLAATHDLDFAARVLPRSIILYQGRVVADGLTLELMKDRQLLETYCLV